MWSILRELWRDSTTEPAGGVDKANAMPPEQASVLVIFATCVFFLVVFIVVKLGNHTLENLKIVLIVVVIVNINPIAIYMIQNYDTVAMFVPSPTILKDILLSFVAKQ
jgi:hypothetical protein